MAEKPQALVRNEERASNLWLKLRAHCESRLAGCRLRLELDREERDTASIRGEIKTLKHLLSLDQDIPLPPDESQFKD